MPTEIHKDSDIVRWSINRRSCAQRVLEMMLVLGMGVVFAFAFYGAWRMAHGG